MKIEIAGIHVDDKDCQHQEREGRNSRVRKRLCQHEKRRHSFNSSKSLEPLGEDLNDVLSIRVKRRRRKCVSVLNNSRRADPISDDNYSVHGTGFIQ